MYFPSDFCRDNNDFYINEWIKLVILFTFTGIGFSVVIRKFMRYFWYRLLMMSPKILFWLEKRNGYKKKDEPIQSVDKIMSYYHQVKKEFDCQIDLLNDSDIKTRLNNWSSSLESFVKSYLKDGQVNDIHQIKPKLNKLLDEFYSFVEEVKV